MDELHVDLQKVISALAYGRRMSSEEMHAYYWENDCGPLEVGGNKPDPLGLADKYESASRFIFRQAALGVVSIFGRRGLDRDPVGFPKFPEIFSDYALIPKETFIADCQFSPGLHSVLWAKHSLIFDGWFDPMMTEDDAKQLAREWPSAEADERLPVGNGVAHVGEFASRQRRTKAVKLSEYMASEFAADPGKSVPEWRRHFKFKNMNEYEAADEATILKACGFAWPPK